MGRGMCGERLMGMAGDALSSLWGWRGPEHSWAGGKEPITRGGHQINETEHCQGVPSIPGVAQ